jgi:hypothetical protein
MDLRDEIMIEAPAAEVWAVLTDTASYPTWNPFIVELTGELAVGSTLRAVIRVPGRRPMTFKPRLLTVSTDQELRWIGRLGVRGLLDGEHGFVLEAVAPDRTRFIQSERFSGVLVPLMRKSLAGTTDGFRMMNEALRTEVERRRATTEP